MPVPFPQLRQCGAGCHAAELARRVNAGVVWPYRVELLVARLDLVYGHEIRITTAPALHVAAEEVLQGGRAGTEVCEAVGPETGGREPEPLSLSDWRTHTRL